MSAIAATLAIQAGKQVGKFLLDKYGDDAVRELTQWVTERRTVRHTGGDQPEMLEREEHEALDALQAGIKETLIELGRPYEEFFGPRVGAEKPAEPQPPTSAPTQFPYRTLLHFHPLQVNEAYLLDPRDTIWVDDDRSLWAVTSWNDPTVMVPVIGVTWHRDPVQVPQKG